MYPQVRLTSLLMITLLVLHVLFSRDALIFSTQRSIINQNPYLQGAQNVRCARCSHVTPVPPPVNQDTMAQLQCNSCRTVLMYPRGAMQVQCSLCQTLNDAQQANQLGHVVCGGCQITLMYAFGAQSVKCALCNHVTSLASSRPPQPSTQHSHHHHHHHPPPHHHAPYPSRTPAAPYHQPQQQQQQQGQDGVAIASLNKPVQAVLVENPPSLDESGNEIQNVSLGVK
jgi:LSD1 subclass zinc finger protein